MAADLPDLDNIQRFNIFVGLTGGLEEERQALEALVEEMNRALVSEPLRVEVFAGYSRAPHGGRPQSVINESVDVCHVFVGILHDKIGFPSGIADSGFLEELGRIKTRQGEKHSKWPMPAPTGLAVLVGEGPCCSTLNVRHRRMPGSSAASAAAAFSKDSKN